MLKHAQHNGEERSGGGPTGATVNRESRSGGRHRAVRVAVSAGSMAGLAIASSSTPKGPTTSVRSSWQRSTGGRSPDALVRPLVVVLEDPAIEETSAAAVESKTVSARTPASWSAP